MIESPAAYFPAKESGNKENDKELGFHFSSFSAGTALMFCRGSPNWSTFGHTGFSLDKPEQRPWWWKKPAFHPPIARKITMITQFIAS
jgi:hypothetical protein